MRVLWTRRAFQKLDEIQDYIAQESPSSAYRVVHNIYQRTNDALSQNPKLGRPGRINGTREFVLTSLPYIVVYRVLDVVEIVTVRHTAQDWPKRIDDA